ncbi:hypothetical protein [Sphaerisporangium corydalis]|uniref:Secreted protein n=1 Tax=Sphaerisporangium corydalis TaxID=1441875 RepID=A0ABV9EMN3_9ACTN|nr:hypothetical protein [Sphaerisporangium corydalis]
MRNRLITLGALITLTLATGLATPAAAAAQSAAAKVFRGRATVTLESYDYCGSGGGRRLTGRTTYRTSAQFSTGPRKSYGGYVERNPFTWLFYAGSIGSTGSFQLGSAAVAKPPGVLLGYWTSTYSASGRFSGRLVATHSDKATTYNTFYGQQALIPCRDGLGSIPMVYALKTGARITGVIGGSGARLTLTGSTNEGFYAFRVVFTA